jgi:threonine dehydrogenase-like Zn-dependent dehydrogenase
MGRVKQVALASPRPGQVGSVVNVRSPGRRRGVRKGEETVDVCGVGAIGVLAAAMEPELEKLLVAVDLGERRQCIRRKRPLSRKNYVEHKTVTVRGKWRTF